MALKQKIDLRTDKTIQVGGLDKKTGKPNAKSIEGYYLGHKDTKSDYGPGKLHHFQTEDGVVAVWGKTNSNRLLTSELKGQMVRLTFTGMGKPSKGKAPAYEFKVEHDEENTIDASGVDLNAAELESSEAEESSFEEPVAQEEESFDEEVSMDEVIVASRPIAKIAAPTKSAQSQVQALLNSRRK